MSRRGLSAVRLRDIIARHGTMKKVITTKEISTADGSKLSELRKQLRAFRFQMAGGRSKNVREGRKLKHDIARALTSIAAQK